MFGFRRSRNRRDIPLPLAAVSAMLIALIALLSVGSLWLLRQLHRQSALHNAASSVLLTGQALARELAAQGVVCSTDPTPRQWRQFARTISALHSFEPNLQFVSVTHDGITVFHKQADRLDLLQPPMPSDASAQALPETPEPVSVSGRILDLGHIQVPVMVFTRNLQLPDGGTVRVEVGLKREAVTQEEQVGVTAVTSMFRISVATILAAFGLCLALISWLVRREQRRERRRQQAEHLAFSGMLANGIAHDFRNPMSSVRLDAQLLTREAERGDQASATRLAELARRVSHTVERMDQVFREFLYLSHPRTDRRESVSLRECAEDCIATLRGRIEQAGLRVDTDWPDTPLMIESSPATLRRALTNIMLNAIQFSPPGGLLRLRGCRLERTIRLEIEDNGPGIPAGSRRKVLDLFYTTRPGGTGLGLFLAKTAVESGGGHITILPASPAGVCVRLEWPAPKTSGTSS